MRVTEHIPAHAHPLRPDLAEGAGPVLEGVGDVPGDELGDSVRRLGGRLVPDAVEDLQPAGRRPGRQVPHCREGNAGIVLAGQGQERSGDLGQPGPDVEVGQRVAGGGVALGVTPGQVLEQGGRPTRIAVGETRAEPTHLRGVEQHRRAAGADGLRPLVPSLGLPDLRARTAEGRRPDPVGRIEHQLETDSPAERVAGVVERRAGPAPAVDRGQHRGGQVS